MKFQNFSETAFRMLPRGQMKLQDFSKTAFTCLKPPNKFTCVSKIPNSTKKQPSKSTFTGFGCLSHATFLPQTSVFSKRKMQLISSPKAAMTPFYK